MSHCARRLLALLLSICACPVVLATSCGRLEERAFVECSNAECSVAFRARQHKVPGQCTVRLLVDRPPPDWSAAVLEKAQSELSTGTFEILISHRYYGRTPETGVELSGAFREEGWRAPRVFVNRQPNGQNIGGLEREWENRALLSLAGIALYWTIEVLLFLGSVWGILRCASSFRARVNGTSQGSPVSPLLCQMIIFGFIVLCTVGSASLVMLAVPVLLATWLYEFAFAVHVHLRRRRGEL